VTLVAKWTIGLVGKQAAARFRAATRSVEASQTRKLLEILRKNEGTEYGREHGFAGLSSLEAYERAVPVIGYQDISERVERMARGEANVLTAENPLMFARTSGTTGKPKLIPVTPTCRGRDHSDQMRTWLYHAQVDHPGIFRGKVMSLVSPAVEGRTEAGIPYGSTSGSIYRNLPSLIQRTYLVPYEVFEIEDYAAKYYVLMRMALAADVTFLCTANPSSIVKLCEHAQEHADELIRDVRDGTLARDLELPPETRAIVEQRCRPEPSTARALEKMRERREGKLLPADYWPNLELIGCWKGGTVGSYLDQFGEWFDPEGDRPMPVRDLGYLSSEARGSIPLSDEGQGGVLTVGTNVYEFVEAETLEAKPDEPESWDFLGAHELDAPREYYVFVTTTGGLYRYDINDVVRVEDFHGEAPIISFQRKGRGMASITGEKVSVEQVIEAVTAAAEGCGVTIPHFRAVADFPGARYLFQVEPEQELSEAKGRELLAAIEKKLASSNIEYEGKRKSERLKAPELHVMQKGWYDRGKADQGKRIFQAKTVVLVPREGDEESVRSKEMCSVRIPLEAGENGAG
jgi:hypothetical protein